MVDIEQLIIDLQYDEGYREEIYECTEGYATFGCGHKVIQSDPEYGYPIGTPVSEDRCADAFQTDIDNILSNIYAIFPDFDNLPEEVQLILLNMNFQMGLNGLSKFKNMRAAIDNQYWQTAADEMTNSKWFYQTPNRAKRLIARMRAV